MNRRMRWLTTLALWLLAAAAHAGTVTYVYTDPQGTPLAEANASGTITARFDYAPYGVAITANGMSGAPNGPGYTGHVNDPDTGLVYMQARYYDPAVGRFLSVDPVEPAVGDGFSFNRYDYGRNNPIVNLDPDGRQTAKTHDDDTDEQRQREMEERRRRRAEEAGMGTFGGGIVIGGKLCDADECEDGRKTISGILQADGQALTEAGKTGGKFIAVNFLTEGFGKILGEAASFIGFRYSIFAGKNENQIYHVFRHTDLMGLDRNEVNRVVSEDLHSIGEIEIGKPINRPITVGGINLQYTVYKSQDGSINVGRIHAQ